MIAILEPTEKRSAQRIPTDVRASVTGDGAFVACAIRNVADDGAKVKLLAHPAHLYLEEGTEVYLNVPAFSALCGRVIWIDEDYLGIQFNEPHQVTAHMH